MARPSPLPSHLVESYRQEEGKVKQRVLLSLGRVEENKLEELAEAINKHLENPTENNRQIIQNVVSQNQINALTCLNVKYLKKSTVKLGNYY